MLSKLKAWEKSSYATQGIVYRTVTFSAAFLNKNVGRLQPKENGLGSDNNKWVLYARTKKWVYFK